MMTVCALLDQELASVVAAIISHEVAESRRAAPNCSTVRFVRCKNIAELEELWSSRPRARTILDPELLVHQLQHFRWPPPPRHRSLASYPLHETLGKVVGGGAPHCPNFELGSGRVWNGPQPTIV